MSTCLVEFTNFMDVVDGNDNIFLIKKNNLTNNSELNVYRNYFELF